MCNNTSVVGSSHVPVKGIPFNNVSFNLEQKYNSSTQWQYQLGFHFFFFFSLIFDFKCLWVTFDDQNQNFIVTVHFVPCIVVA